MNRRAALEALVTSLALGGLNSCTRRAPHGEPSDLGLSESFDADAELASRLYSARTLGRALAMKAGGRLSKEHPVRPAAVYNGVVVFHRPELEGGGLTFGQDFARALMELGLCRCERIFEFCAGPGYIGYSLLANGFCERLTLADINPFAVEAARRTARYNKIQHLVNVYQSDALKRIPDTEKWDLVVGNPPHFLPARPVERSLLSGDPGWSVHRDFYSSVKRFMKPGGHVVLVENPTGSKPGTFEPMIREGGGTLLKILPAVLVTGRSTGFYYVVSRW